MQWLYCFSTAHINTHLSFCRHTRLDTNNCLNSQRSYDIDLPQQNAMCNKFRYIRTMVFFCLCELKIQHHLDLPKLASCDSLCYILHSKYQRKRVYSIYLFQQNRAQRRKNREEKCRCVISAQISYENWLLTCAKTSHKCTQCCPNYIARWTNGVCKWIDIFAKYSFCAAKW